MSIHLQREIDKLKRDLLLICSIVEEQVQKAIRALFDRDARLAQEVQTMDEEVDRREINLEEECLKTLALHQPVAINLRQLVAALKINNDLERIGDHGVNIAESAIRLAAEPDLKPLIDIPRMAALAMIFDMVCALLIAIRSLHNEPRTERHRPRWHAPGTPSECRPLHGPARSPAPRPAWPA